jgi:DNA-binding transcriptional ArsR family regulator
MTADLDTLFEILADRTRRRTLLLVEADEVGTVEELLDRLKDDRADAAVSLTHVHLPKLEDAGYIRWDPDDGRITRGPRLSAAAPYLDVLRRRADDRRSDYF